MSLSVGDHVFVRFWQEHTCLGCGCGFAYRDQFHIQPESIPEKATADGIARKMLDGSVKKPKSIPCPQCGWVQPDMVGDNGCGHILSTFFVGLGISVVLVITGIFGFQPTIPSFAIAGMLLIGLVWNAIVVFSQRPNADLKANRNRVQLQVGVDWVRMISPRDKKRPKSDSSVRPGSFMLLGVLTATVPLALTPVVWAQSMWVILPLVLIVFVSVTYRLFDKSYIKTSEPIPGRVSEVRIDVTTGTDPADYDYLPAGVER